MDQIMEIIRKRQSIRAYKSQMLSREIIDSLLEAAKNAPSARNLQQLEYKIITNKALMQKLSDGIGQAFQMEMNAVRPGSPATDRPSFFYKAPLLILITGPRENSWIDTDAALAVENIMLYAASIGLGSCFIGMARFIDKSLELRRELHISEGQRIAAAVICGYPDEKPAPKEKKLKAEFFS